MILFSLISYLSLHTNGQQLDCAYVQDPQYNIQQETLSFTGAYPLSSCRIESNMQLFSGIFASEYTCDDSSNLYVSIWNHTNICNHNISPTYYIPLNSSTEYNCNSINECEHITLETYTVDNKCIKSTTPIFRDTEITNKCIDVEAISGNMSYILSSCNTILGMFTITYYESIGCNGIIYQIFNVSGEGIFEFSQQFQQLNQYGYYVTTNCQINNRNKSLITCDLPSNYSNKNEINVQVKSKQNNITLLLVITLSIISVIGCIIVIGGMILVGKLVPKTVFISIPNQLNAMQTLADTNYIHNQQENINESNNENQSNDKKIDNTYETYEICQVELVDIMEDIALR
eukprot:353870_1